MTSDRDPPLLTRIIALAVGVASGSAALETPAAEWRMNPSVLVKSEYTNNYFVQPSRQSAWVNTVGPTVRLTGSTETLSSSLGAGLFGRWVTGISDQNTWNAGLDWNTVYRRERSTFGLDVKFLRDSTLVSELQQTGVVLNSATRNYYSITPNWNYILTERWSLALSGIGAWSRYQNAAPGTLNNSDAYSGTAGLLYELTQQTQLSGSVTYRSIKYSPNVSETSAGSFQVGGSHRFTETTRGSLSVGYFNSDSQFQAGALVCPGPVVLCDTGALAPVRLTQTVDTRASGFLAEGSFQAALTPATSVSARLRQDLYPSGSGSVVKSSTLALGLGHQFTEKLRGNVDASAVRSLYLADQLSNRDAWYSALSAGLAYQMAPNLWLEGAYRFSWVNYDSASTADAQVNAVYGLIRYDWPPTSVSR